MVRGFIRHALANPLRDGLRRLRVRLKPLSALVLHTHRGLLQDEAVLGQRGEDTTTARIVDELHEIGPRVESEDREAEAGLPARFRVAGAEVATGFGEDG